MIKTNTPPFTKTWLLVSGLTAGLCCSSLAFAAVDADTAARLNGDLTPLGAIRAANADGSIPAWTGEVVNAELAENGGRIDPFAGEKPQVQITAANYQQYKEQLTEGQVALFEKYPDTFRMDVYPTHRTHAAPQYVYDNTFKNATRAQLDATGNSVDNAYGGIPFPVPQNGSEVVWNHLLRWVGEGAFKEYVSVTVQDNGALGHGGGDLWETYPYYAKDGSIETFNGNLLELLLIYNKPTRRKGEVILLQDPMDQASTPRQAWQYIPGQRRVRRAPTIAFDTPNAQFNGQATYDNAFMFNGSPERYDWTLAGKKEMYIPYNNNHLIQAFSEGDSKIREIATPHHPNPDYERWEKHRVWVLDATLKEGKRHVYAKRRFYLDEDSWAIVATDIYDGRGNLWRVGFASMLNAYDLPGTLIRGNWHTDLQNGAYAFNEIDTKPIKLYKGEEHGFYTPSNVRKLSRR
ncbi:DUF1329 domain-containing protein [Amphritea opalescens]|uniref:DUF1329 domain-containing protein n=1 Tax=Amphritea opalescens TaxID=2490544 RepID=A0A430KM25_9GAMM|nr:DUF1329 domain-containing protein [Amphritea opalescens]RTE64528.1 DUF1329 domain-containing protein [Amphritea opalescens]